jgi:choice-of-anchor A domain-containing protein
VKNSYHIFVFFVMSLVASQALATPPAPTVSTNAHVGTYNLILQNDLSTSSEIEGRALIRGNVTSSNTIVFGAALPSSPTVDAVSVAGNITPGLTIQNGHNAVYGGTNSGFNLNGGGSAAMVNQATLLSEFDAIYNQVIADSATFAGLAATGSFNGSDNNNKLFTANETAGLNIINVNASYLTNGGEFDFSSAPNVPVVINVIGGGDLVITAKAGNKGAGLQGDALASMVLWNFNTASSIAFNSDGWVGSILAPYANITGTTGHLEGSLAAKSYGFNGQGVELHNSLFAYTPPTVTPPTNDVPAPAGLMLLSLGLLFMARRKILG